MTMSYLVFARKYRPQRFEDVVQQEHVTRTLSNAIAKDRLPHALLFTGPRGTGKTTVARILAKAMNCLEGPTAKPCNICRSCKEITSGHAADVFEIDGASNNSVDQVRELRDNLKYMPAHSRYKIYIIDEVHMLSTAAFNALLKTLEEPPEHVLFIFATTEPQKIPITILSRCQRHDLRRIDLAGIVKHMQWICDQEQIDIDEPSLSLIAREAGGSLRDALSLLDHVLACSQDQITADMVGELLGLVERRDLFALSAAVLARDVQRVLLLIDRVWRAGYEIRRFYADVVSLFHQMVLVKLGQAAQSSIDVPRHEFEQMKAQVDSVPDTDLLQIVELLFQAEPAIKMSSQPKLALEMVFLKLFQTPPALSVDMLIDRLEQLRATVASGTPLQTAEQKARRSASGPAGGKPIGPSGDRTPMHPHPQVGAQSPPEVHPRTIADASELWERVQARVVEERPSLAGFLSKASIKTVQENLVELEIFGNEFVLNNIKKHLPFLETIIADQQGQEMKIAVSANIQDAAEKEDNKKKTDLIKTQTLSHPMVAEALDLFDGKVIDVKVNNGLK
jgi:DNA polymerase-3 subunit gamma/tau